MSDLVLAAEFPEAKEGEWVALVEKALKGRPFEKAMVTKTADGITIDPLYFPDADAAPAGGPLPGTAPFARGFTALPESPAWDIGALHEGPDIAQANEAILSDLEGGASSLTLHIAAPGQSGLSVTSADDLDRLLQDVLLDYAGIYLEAGARFEEITSMLMDVWARRGVSGDQSSGGIHADPLGTLARIGSLPTSLDDALAALARVTRAVSDAHPNVTSALANGLPYHDAGASEAQELAYVAATVAAYLRAFEANGIAPAEGLPKIAVALAADADQFLSLAKLRAGRMLIARIAEACGCLDAARSVSLEARTSGRMMTRRDPWVNLLRTTIACAAAAMGGAGRIIVLPYTWAIGLTDLFARRIARNTQIILMEESSLGLVADPAGGSAYVESLTEELARKAWDIFQSIERDGGLATALADGSVQRAIAETRAGRAPAIATAKTQLIGISAFPELRSAPVEAPARPAPVEEDAAITVEPLGLHRLAEPFETLRDAADAYAERAGGRAKLFLANIGRQVQYGARATFSTNFFAAGGIESVGDTGYESAEELADAFAASGAPIACICSSDDVYAERGAEVARALAARGAKFIYLAGRPGDLRDELNAAGVGDYIHLGSNMLGQLEEAHDRFGIRT